MCLGNKPAPTTTTQTINWGQPWQPPATPPSVLTPTPTPGTNPTVKTPTSSNSKLKASGKGKTGSATAPKTKVNAPTSGNINY